MEFTFYTADKIVFKRGALKEAGNYIARLGKKFLVIIDPFFAESPAMEDLTRQLEALGADYLIFSEVRGEPTVDLVDEVSRLALASQCDAVISLGGGSCIDVGKATAAIITMRPAVDYLEVVGRGKGHGGPGTLRSDPNHSGNRQRSDQECGAWLQDAGIQAFYA